LSLRKTCLYSYHKEHGNLVEFDGFAMPVWFDRVITEHHAVRNAVGVFDTTYMGRMMVEGPDTERFLNYVVTNDVSRLDLMGGLYTVMCNPRGGVVDDLILYKLADDRVFIVYNGSNLVKDFAWMEKQSKGFDVKLTNLFDEMAMIAVQGPKAEATLQKICAEPVSEIGRFQIARVHLSGLDAMMARTGYTGEDGFECFPLGASLENPEPALRVWNDLLEAGEEFGIMPCGLGARDSLRLEAGLWLYGDDMNDDTNPLEAGLGWVVKFKKPSDFIGREALLKVREEGLRRRLVGIMMEDRGLPRHGYEIWDGDERIGEVTSGGLGPTLGVGIALGYVPVEYREIGTPVRIKIRDRLAKGKIVKHRPFYDETKYGWKRDRT